MEKKLQKRTVVKLLKNWKENGKKYDNCTKQEERIFKDKNKIIAKTEKITELNTRRKREKIIAGGSKNKNSRKGKMTKEQYDSETNTKWQSKKKKQ